MADNKNEKNVTPNPYASIGSAEHSAFYYPGGTARGEKTWKTPGELMIEQHQAEKERERVANMNPVQRFIYNRRNRK